MGRLAVTFLKFQEKPKASGVYYVYEYRSFREKSEKADKGSSNYGKVRHALVAYHGRADKALKKLLERAPEFSQETWKKMVRYAKESRKPGSPEIDTVVLSQKFTVPELKFLMLFAPKEKLLYDQDLGTVTIGLDDLAQVINSIEEIPIPDVKKIIQSMENVDDFKVLAKEQRKICIFSDTEYFAGILAS